VPKFNYDDIVRVIANAHTGLTVPKKAWVVGIFERSPGPYFSKFPPGTVYTVEFEDGSAIEVHECDLQVWVA
jgi:hypothetical protein